MSDGMMTGRHGRPIVLALGGDKAAARAAWKSRFENRTVRTPAAASGLKVIAKADADKAEIKLYDEIGFWGVTAKEFTDALDSIEASTIVLRINSPGGDVFDGLAMHAALKSHAARVEVVIEGVAASAASFIALAGDTVSMHESAMMMIHRAWGVAIGNQSDMAAMQKVLAKIDGQLAGIYAARTGKSVADMLAAMTGESDGTWYTAEEAGAANLIDEVIALDAGGDDADTTATARATVARMRNRLALAACDI